MAGYRIDSTLATHHHVRDHPLNTLHAAKPAPDSLVRVAAQHLSPDRTAPVSSPPHPAPPQRPTCSTCARQQRSLPPVPALPSHTPTPAASSPLPAALSWLRHSSVLRAPSHQRCRQYGMPRGRLRGAPPTSTLNRGTVMGRPLLCRRSSVRRQSMHCGSQWHVMVAVLLYGCSTSRDTVGWHECVSQ